MGAEAGGRAAVETIISTHDDPIQFVGVWKRREAVLIAEIARLRAVAAAARAWCHTYAVRDLTPEEAALMLAVAALEDDDPAR